MSLLSEYSLCMSSLDQVPQSRSALSLLEQKPEKGAPLTQKPRIAYYLWRFPVLTETFIRREVEALRQSGIPIEIIADGVENSGVSDEELDLFVKDTHYLRPLDEKLLKTYHKYFFLRNPWLYVKLFLYIVSQKYDLAKSVKQDLFAFSHAVYLAGVLKDKSIGHVHSPWANRCAFTALIAAKLLGVRYTVQARASADLYRNRHAFALAQKFAAAEFVITNTRFNESYIKSLVEKQDWQKIFVIHNGINLEQFDPPKRKSERLPEIKLLTVATLGETKGLIDLLRACKNLQERGYAFRCEIVGGAHQLYLAFESELKKLHRELELEACVFFLGAQPFPKVLQKYKEADVFVLPCVTANDGSQDITPNALIEAMAMKLPVVSTDITGIPEIVEDGVSGILVPPNSPVAISEAIVRIANDPELRRGLEEQARRKVEKQFDIDKNIVRYVELFARNS